MLLSEELQLVWPPTILRQGGQARCLRREGAHCARVKFKRETASLATVRAETRRF